MTPQNIQILVLCWALTIITLFCGNKDAPFLSNYYRLLTSVLVVALPDIPSGSIVILMIILQSTGLPTKDIATLFTVEWFL
jgi:Na+/H+-dicarboxylate symporter